MNQYRYFIRKITNNTMPAGILNLLYAGKYILKHVINKPISPSDIWLNNTEENHVKWEYKIERLKPEKKWGSDEKLEPLEECLDHMGNKGWELINVTHQEGLPYILFFKRPKI